MVEPRGRLVGSRASSADDSHPESGAETPDVLADPTRTHNTDRFSCQQRGAIGHSVERGALPIDGSLVESSREVEKRRHHVLGDRQGVPETTRGCHNNVAAPQIAPVEVASASGSLVEPAKTRRPGNQVDWNWESAKDNVGDGEHFVSLRPRWDVVSCAEIGVGGLVTPRRSELTVEPPRSHMEFDRRIGVLDLPAGSAAQWYQ